MRYAKISCVLCFLGVEWCRGGGSSTDDGSSMSGVQMLQTAQTLVESQETQHKWLEGAKLVTERAFNDALWWLTRSMLMEPGNFDAQKMVIDMLLNILDEVEQMKKVRLVVEDLAAAGNIAMAGALAGNVATLASKFNGNREALLKLAYDLYPSNLASEAVVVVVVNVAYYISW